MPNHCENELRVWGSSKSLRDFADFARTTITETNFLGQTEVDDNPLDFNKAVKYPQEFKDKDVVARTEEKNLRAMTDEERKSYLEKNSWPKDGFNSGGYDWCLANWGTKWNSYDHADVKHGKRSMLYRFSTAWGPPVPVVRAFAKKFPDLTFQIRYFERGCAFKGVFKVKGDVVLKAEQSEYHGRRGG